MRSSVALLAIFAALAGLARAGTDRPIIGILTQPTSGSMAKYGKSYVAASYVKYVEASGARAAVVFHNSNDTELAAAFAGLNGVLFPGGGASLDHTPMLHAGTYFVNHSVGARMATGEIFPVVGHCMGFEMLMTIVAGGDSSVLSPVDAENISLPLEYVQPTARESRLFGTAPADVAADLGTLPITMNNHQQCVTTSTFAARPELGEFFSVLSTNKGRQGVQFVSSAEAHEFPIYAVQWHPEKTLFEWYADEAINHSPEGVRAMQYMSRFMGDQARLSTHKFPSLQEETSSLFYNYVPVYTEPFEHSFEQTYFFDR
jgi:gamma-glutamyl hydrolase